MKASTLLALVLAALVGTFAATLPARDSDLFWHLASGAWMLDHRAILDRDVFSFTMAGTPYSVGQWLGEIAYAALFRWAGWIAIDLLRGLLVGVAAFFTARAVLRFQPHPAWAAVTTVAALLVTTLIWGDRPQLFSLALFPAFLDTLLAARNEGRGRRPWALVPLAFVWAQLHGAFVIGLGLLAIFTVDAFIARLPARRTLLAVTLAAAVATQLTPSGIGAFTFAASYATTASAVVEEQPLSLGSAAALVYLALLAVSLVAAVRVGMAGVRAATVSPVLWAMLAAAFFVLAALHQRNLPYAAIVVAPVAAALVPRALGSPRASVPSISSRVGVAIVGGVLAAAVAVALVAAPRSPDLSSYPEGAVPILRDRAGNVFHEYDWGGYLIFALPEHPTYIDGRGAALYPPLMIQGFQDTAAARSRDALRIWDIRYVLLRVERPLVSALQADGWRTLGRDTAWIVLERP